jgi:hypothetical protein
MGFTIMGWVRNIPSAEMNWSEVCTDVITSTALFWNVTQWSPVGIRLQVEEQIPDTLCYISPV